MNEEKTKRIELKVGAKMKEALEAHSAKTHITVSELIRMWICEKLGLIKKK